MVFATFRDVKRETWLRANRRIFGAALAVYGVLSLLALAAIGVLLASGGPRWMLIVASVILAFLLLGVCWLAVQIGRPRLAYRAGDLLVFVRQGAPVRIPVSAVECFLIGRAPTQFPGRKFAESETVTLVVRLSPRAEEFRQQPTDPRLGFWCDSHITLRGTWCEPISVPRVNELNAKLAAAQRASKASATVAVTRQDQSV